MTIYTMTVPFKDFHDKPRTEKVHFNLTEREVIKLLPQLKHITDWLDAAQGPYRELDTEEVVEFYNAFEDVLLSAWGIPSDDGMYMNKDGRYKFESSALFAACMVQFVSDPTETNKLLEAILPKGMKDLVEKADSNLKDLEKNSSDEDLRRQLAELRSRLEEKGA